MKNEQRLSLQIAFFTLILFLLSLIVFLFIFSEAVSLKDFFLKIFIEKILFGKKITYFYIYVLLRIFGILFGVYFLSYYFIGKYFSQIKEYNSKLKDYNHFLAHELKTPISIIYSNLDVLKYDFDKQKIQKSQNELKNITKIIDGLLYFSESLNISNKKDINLENFIKNYIQNSFKTHIKKIKIINREFNFSIITDEVLFLRVIKNLIENALKYSIDGILKIYIKKDKLIFENKIEKTFGKKELNKIFEKFYSKSFNENKGFGLGLTMIKEIVKVLGYKMEVFSKDNKFIVEIIY